MELFLLDSEFKTERTLPSYRTPNIGYIRLPIGDERAKSLLDSFGKNIIFTIVVRSPSSYPPISDLYVKFSSCVPCGYGRINGAEHFQINFWEHNPLSLEEKRDLLIGNILPQ